MRICARATLHDSADAPSVTHKPNDSARTRIFVVHLLPVQSRAPLVGEGDRHQRHTGPTTRVENTTPAGPCRNEARLRRSAGRLRQSRGGSSCLRPERLREFPRPPMRKRQKPLFPKKCTRARLRLSAVSAIGGGSLSGAGTGIASSTGTLPPSRSPSLDRGRLSPVRAEMRAPMRAHRSCPTVEVAQ
jgi:hypothetical protein